MYIDNSIGQDWGKNNSKFLQISMNFDELTIVA